jgi:hypothetical protein
MTRDTGSLPISEADEMNIPVVCFLTAPDRGTDLWKWSAVNFMPRKEYCGGNYRLEADTKEEIMELIRKYVIPLYEVALENLKERGENYYWERAK